MRNVQRNVNVIKMNRYIEAMKRNWILSIALVIQIVCMITWEITGIEWLVKFSLFVFIASIFINDGVKEQRLKDRIKELEKDK